MPSHGLHPDVALSVRLDAICARNQYTDEPAPVVAELLATAGDRTDILAEAVTWIGYFEDDYTRTLATALRALPLDMDDAIALGQYRRSIPDHRTPAPRA